MNLRSLLHLLADDASAPTFARDGGRAFVSASMRAYVTAAVADALDGPLAGQPLIVVAGDDRQARDLHNELGAWLDPRPVFLYPSRGVAYESHLAPPPHLVGLRVAALDALLNAGESDEAPVVVVSAAALSEKLPDPELRPESFTLRVGDLVDLNEIGDDLVACGYERVDQVADRGQYAIRGGLLDIYPATADNAVRVDLFDIEIESLREFSTFTQRSLGETDALTIAPAAELAPAHREKAIAATLDDESERPDIAELLPVDRFRAFLDLTPSGTGVLIAAEEELGPALTDHWHDVEAALHDADAHHLYVKPDAILDQLSDRAHARISSLHDEDQRFEFRAQAADFAARSLSEAEPQLEKLVRSGYRTVVAWPHRGDGERTAYNLARLKAHWLGEGSGGAASIAPRGAMSGPHSIPEDLRFTVAGLRDGFIAGGPMIAVIPAHRLLRRRRAASDEDRPSRRRGALRSFSGLSAGDHVVHEDHGVARFAGFDTKTVGGITRDYLQLEFAGEDKVFMPVEQLAKISRYIGAGAAAPALSKLGGKSWETLKARARKAAQELAGELINLYAERRRRSGHSFGDDSEWLVEFESKFPHTETADQREAIEHVKSDMESERPMDRLICGDVGYGKTEVALRAAFKAADAGKQVLMLAPTTILAQQHFGTFSERLRDYPFTIDHVSRFRSAAEQRAAVAAFNEGKTDILIGTHRLLGRDLRGKDIGLIVVDEEQRFGVKQKELLRQLKLKVDVISMSATPIPRTLQMSLAGVRDISVIETPPEGRRPVKTFVGEYDEGLVKQAITREVGRGGQAFFVHNRVESIDETAERLRGLCPGVRFEVAHGQLSESELEERMLSFLRGEADVLVATSIIESGIDIPQANTLIVERADLFGLAQLYQIRGRVGRARERAYAYLMYPAHAALTDDAMKRLSALSDYTELGAGFQIAMRDLEIRGAGNLLGDEQSGHVAALGFELYMQMLEEAVIAMEALPADDREPVRLDADVDAYVPADYIAYEQAKIDVHRRIAAARDVAELGTLAEELADRFGPPPEPLENLLALQRARIKFGLAGARAVTVAGDRLAVTPVDLGEAQTAELRERLADAKYEPGRSQLSRPLPKGGAERFAAIRATADALLAIAGDGTAREAVAAPIP